MPSFTRWKGTLMNKKGLDNKKDRKQLEWKQSSNVPRDL